MTIFEVTATDDADHQSAAAFTDRLGDVAGKRPVPGLLRPDEPFESGIFRRRRLPARPGTAGARNASQVSVDDLLTDLSGAEELMAAEFDEIEKINAQPDLVARLAEEAGARQEKWRVTGIDPQGLELTSPGSAARLWFSERVETSLALADALARPFHRH